VPTLLKLAVSEAEPEVNVAVPSELAPLRNVTVPVAAAGTTVAVKVTDVPSTAVLLDAARLVVVAVPPVLPEEVDPPGGCQKSPHPVKRIDMAINVSRNAIRTHFNSGLISSPLCVR